MQPTTYGPLLLICIVVLYLFIILFLKFLTFLGFGTIFVAIIETLCGCTISDEKRMRFAKFGFDLPQHYIKAENNPDYFDAIPKSVMKWRCSTGTLTPDMKEKYQQIIEQQDDITIAKRIEEEIKHEMEGGIFHAKSVSHRYILPKVTKKDGSEIELVFIGENDNIHKLIQENEKKQLVGHESYNMTTSLEYSKKFGFQTDHMRRKSPTDWIFSSAKLKPFTNDIPEVIDLIKRCSPRRNSHGKIPHMVKLGLFLLNFVPIHFIIWVAGFFPSSCR